MSLELELRLEGQDANEDTLSDLMNWLERAREKNSPTPKAIWAGWLIHRLSLLLFQRLLH